ncbi:MAG TPA: nuclear transport factor 2 family protein [Bacteroidia bacterium]|jgi:ketosteroid isomerase-like protein|nr:nuclear transport factor 2 family protein [Bacteroidia bacterium]
MSESPIVAIAHKWFDAFNEHDLEKLLTLYADDAQHYSPKLKLRQPETNGLIKGKKALRTWWKDSFDRLPGLKYVPKQFIADDSHVFMEYIRYVDGEENLTVGEVLEIKNGLIVSSRVYHS